MTAKNEIISKIEYDKPAFGGYAWVKQYSLVRRGEEKYVVLRFFNDLGRRIDKLFFTLEQINAQGKLLDVPEQKHVACVGLRPDDAFEWEIAVDRECVAVRVRIDKVHACGDEYSLQNEGATESATPATVRRSSIPSEFLISEDRSRSGRKWALAAIAFAAVATITLMSLLFAFFNGIR